MKRELLTISQHPEIVLIDRKLRDLVDDATAQVVTLKHEVDRKKNALWDEAEDYLRAKELLPPDFSRNTHVLNVSDGKLYLIDGPELIEHTGGGLPKSLLRALKGALGGDEDGDPLRPPGARFGSKKNGTQH